MEAYSVEDNGRGVKFCIYAYNVQPGVTIDYFTGINVANGEKLPEIDTEDGRDENVNTPKPDDSDKTDKEEDKDKIPNDGEYDYVLNTNSKKFHIPGKSCANSISDKNRENYCGTREELIADGYVPCGICKP